MATDPARRDAARTATFIAVPLMLAVLLVSVLVFGDGEEPAPAATGPVTTTARDLSPEVAVVCQLLISELPDTAEGHARRPVTAGAEQNAAYGDPAMTLECGTTLPAVGPTDEVVNVAQSGMDGGVCWYPVDVPGATAWTTVDRQIPVTVTVPGAREGSAQALVAFAAAVGASVPVRAGEEIPTGCSTDPITD